MVHAPFSSCAADARWIIFSANFLFPLHIGASSGPGASPGSQWVTVSSGSSLTLSEIAWTVFLRPGSWLWNDRKELAACLSSISPPDITISFWAPLTMIVKGRHYYFYAWLCAVFRYIRFAPLLLSDIGLLCIILCSCYYGRWLRDNPNDHRPFVFLLFMSIDVFPRDDPSARWKMRITCV